MRKSQFSESEFVGILRDAEGAVPVADLTAQAGDQPADLFLFEVAEQVRRGDSVRRKAPDELEAESARPKRMCCDLALENGAKE